MAGPGHSPISSVVPTRSASARFRPIGQAGVEITGGLWADRRRTNRGVTIPHGARQLEAAGNFNNLVVAATGGSAYRARSDDSGYRFPFLDSDVYKWLEAVGWELGTAPDVDLSADAERAIELVGAAQQGDGYLNSFFQVTTPGRTFHDMEWGHELYTAGHLVQAAVAWHRALGDDRLLVIATRLVDHIGTVLGPGRRELIDGHPGLEMALVELYRVTGDRRHLEMAQTLVERRGRGLLGPGRFGPDYWQDGVAVRAAPMPVGHVVRQLYLDCGAVDVAVETQDGELLQRVIGRWEVMVGTRMYLTGGLGARARDESFGDAFELPPDGAYAETCAAIASVMLAWRLLLASGEPRFADLIERTTLNAVLPGLALDGQSFLYANPLQLRHGSAEATDGPLSIRRSPWFACACCPPNLMRFLAALPELLATTDDRGLQIHQFADARIETDAPFGHVRLEVRTGYPWSGDVDVAIVDAPSDAWTLSARIPAWCRRGSVTVDGVTTPIEAGAGTFTLTRPWRAGDRIRIDFEMPPRITLPDRRIDALRGTAAVERGPVVYAIEEADLPEGVGLDALELDLATPPVARTDDPELPGMRLLEVRARVHSAADRPSLPYTDRADPRTSREAAAGPIPAVPYLVWGNRSPGAMRVWIPVENHVDP